MDALPLPSQPSLEQYRKRAKGLVAAARSGDSDAVRAWTRDWITSLVKALPDKPGPFVQRSVDRAVERIAARVRNAPSSRRSKELALADAQFLIAEAHGFTSWGAFAKHLELAAGHHDGNPFERAADAVVSGDVDTLKSLITRDPSLVRARSQRAHRATLLHYVAANGVEDFRQKTPKNAVEVARLLLERGAEVDAIASTYGNDYWQTTMNLLVSSAHPAGAGLMPALVDVLADYGAATNGLKDDESPLMTALDFGYADAAETLARRGARVDSVVAAAALGRAGLVQRIVIDSHTLAAGTPFVAPPWRSLPDDPTVHIELALVWACKFARTDVAHFLLDAGVNPKAMDGYKMTALHWAAGNGSLDLVKRLLALGAPLEVRNVWQGTVLDSTIHFVVHSPKAGVDYFEVMQLLIDAGADVNAAYPSGQTQIDDFLRRRGAGASRA